MIEDIIVACSHGAGFVRFDHFTVASSEPSIHSAHFLNPHMQTLVAPSPNLFPLARCHWSKGQVDRHSSRKTLEHHSHPIGWHCLLRDLAVAVYFNFGPPFVLKYRNVLSTFPVALANARAVVPLYLILYRNGSALGPFVFLRKRKRHELNLS